MAKTVWTKPLKELEKIASERVECEGVHPASGQGESSVWKYPDRTVEKVSAWLLNACQTAASDARDSAINDFGLILQAHSGKELRHLESLSLTDFAPPALTDEDGDLDIWEARHVFDLFIRELIAQVQFLNNTPFPPPPSLWSKPQWTVEEFARLVGRDPATIRNHVSKAKTETGSVPLWTDPLLGKERDFLINRERYLFHMQGGVAPWPALIPE